MADIRTPEVLVQRRADGAFLLRAPQELPPYPARLTDRLVHWAHMAPDQAFLITRDGAGWRTLTYGAALRRVRAVAAGLLRRAVSAERPLLILSGNSVPHALVGLAAAHVGVPYAPISVAYSTLSSDHAKLRQIVALTTPGLVFIEGGAGYERARAVLPPDLEVVSLADLEAGADEAVDRAHAAVRADTVAKLLFTSGSTGAPKAVINTHGMLCANQAMIADHFPFLAQEPPVIVDWLPWSHTFGGNNNFNQVLYHGGTMVLDEGRPMPGQFGPTLDALRAFPPTLHLAVPKGWEELARHLAADPALNRRFWSRLRVPFYAAASLPQPLWDALAELSRAATGQVVAMVTGLGSTETAPMAFCNGPGGRVAGHVGLPVAGVAVKLAPMDGKLEARIRGPSITPGYWRDPARTTAAFDDEGYYRMGDALAWVDPADPQRGLRFDGRLAEDFKLLSGTWVSVGPLRARLIAAMAPHVRDVVVAGHDRDGIAVLLLPAGPVDGAVRAAVGTALTALAREATGSATRVLRAAFLEGALSIDAGEITDKGSVNQSAILRRRPGEVAALYAERPPAHVISADLEPAVVQP